MTTKICKCDNCGWTGPEDDLERPLGEVHHLGERLDPGSIVPAGECPECTCFAYYVEQEPPPTPDLLAALQALVNYHDDDLHETGREEDPEAFALSDAAHAAIAKAKESAKKPWRIAITVDGGLVQGVITDDPRLVGVEVKVIDYDTEGADESRLSRVPEETENLGETTMVDAYVTTMDIGPDNIGLSAIRKSENVS